MLDMGFIHDIKRILALLPKQRQNLLFSATFSDEIRELADRPSAATRRTVEVAPRNARPPRSSASCVHPVDKDRKRDLLLRPHRRATTGSRCWCSRAPSTAPTASPSS